MPSCLFIVALSGWPLGSLVCGVFLFFVTFPCGVLGQVGYLIVSIPDHCLFSYCCDKQSMSVVLCALCVVQRQQFTLNDNSSYTTTLPAKSKSDVIFCLQSYQGLRIDRSLVY